MSPPKIIYHYLGKTTPEQDARLMKELDKVCDKHGKPWMTVYEFGEKLLYTGDLDPVYTIVWEAQLDPETLRRWLLAYWCFYHVGTASWIVEGKDDYWGRMETAAKSKEYPRSAERRHFRGKNATTSVAWLREQGGEVLWGEFDRARYENRTLDLAEVMEYVQEWVGFGPWIAFKVADMLERLDLVKVNFDKTAMFLFESPYLAAVDLWEEENPKVPLLSNEALASWAVERILTHLKRARTHPEEGKVGLAPPRFERPLGPAECETCLCKGRSYRRGHYEIGEDVKAVRQGLLRFAKCRTAQTLLKAGKKGGLW